MPTFDDIQKLDALYTPFPPFTEWPTSERYLQCAELAAKLASLKGTSSKVGGSFSQAIQVAVRAAALETGAIEKLYSSDRGLTISVAMETAAWDQQLALRSKNARSFFESQLEAYELLIDNVTGVSPLSEAFVRRLHEVMCASQETYEVLTPQGMQEQSLPKGVYKTYANHLMEDRHQKPFAFAPVDLVSDEMQRLIQETRADSFLAADPVVQAAFVHYALVRVHPFSDGNGRVARALASAYLMKAYLVPLLIFSEQRNEYLAALESADGGRWSSVTDLFARCTSASLELALESLTVHRHKDAAVSIDAIKQLYKTTEGLTHREVDLIAYRVAEEIHAQLQSLVEERHLPEEIRTDLVLKKVGMTSESSEVRIPIESGGRVLRFALATARPAEARVETEFNLYVSRSQAEQNRIILAFARGGASFKSFEARLDSVHPTTLAATHARMRTWCVQLLDTSLDRLSALAAASLRKSGY